MEALALVERLFTEYANDTDVIRRAHVMKFDVLISAGRLEEAERCLDAYCEWTAHQTTPAPISGVPIPWPWIALIQEWSGRVRIAKARGGLEAALAALAENHAELTAKLAQDTDLSEEGRARLWEALQVESVASEADLYLKAGDYRRALGVVERLGALTKDEALFAFPGSDAERDRVRRVLDGLSSRVPVGVAVQEYCQAWKDGEYDLMYALRTRRARQAQTLDEFVGELTEAARREGGLVEVRGILVQEVTEQGAIARAQLTFRNEGGGPGASVERVFRLTKEEDAWKIDGIENAETANRDPIGANGQ